MIDFGAANDHSNYISFGDSTAIGYLGHFWGITFAMRLMLKDDGGTWGYIMGKEGAAPSGWAVRFDIVNHTTQPEFMYYNGAWRYHLCTTALTLDTWYSLTFSWRGDQYGFWCIDGAYVNTTDSGIGAVNERISTTQTVPFMIGAGGGVVTSHGAAIEIDNVIIVPNLRLRQAGTTRFAEDYHAGRMPGGHGTPAPLQDRWMASRDRDPGIMNPWFWWTGEYTPGENIIKHSKGGHEAGTETGTVAVVKDTCNKPPWTALELGGSSVMSVGSTPSDTMTGKMPTKLYTEVTERNRTYFGLKLELPDDNDLGFAMSSLPTSDQDYGIAVKNWRPIARNVFDRDNRLTAVETAITIADHNRTLSKLLTGSLDGRAEGSAATIKLVSPHVDSDRWMTVYEGELRRWQPRGNLPEITLFLGPNDKPLRGRNGLGYITKNIYPRVPGTIEGQAMQIVYGTFDSVVGGGLVDCPKVNDDGRRYLASVGMVTPLQAYQAGAMLDPRSGQAEYKIFRCKEREGRWFTEIQPATDASSDAITIDVDGVSPGVDTYFYDYPYTNLWEDWIYSTPITNPAEQILHFLVNFIYGSYMKGPWLRPLTTMPINVASFIEAATWFRARGIKGRAVVYGDETGYQLINRWTRQWKMPIFWGIDGKLTIKPDDFAVVRGSQTNLIDREHGITDLATILKDDALADEVSIRHNYDWVDAEYDDETRAKDLSRDYGNIYDIDQDWSAV